MKKFTVQVVLILAVTVGALVFYFKNPNLPDVPFLPQQTTAKSLQINGAKFKVEIADTQAKRSKGLGEREKLASDEGMLFIFDKADKYPFWMKGLTFPLDFIWIKGDTVVDITQNVPPPAVGQQDSSLTIYQPKEEVNKVLEVSGGTTQRLNIKAGDTITLN